MSTVTFDGAAATSNPADQRSKSDALHIAALGLLSIRFIQGFIYWDGGSRRFIYAPAKLDPHAANWMANKLQSAMPGRCVGTDHIIAFLLHHFHLLYASLILFSAAELITGLFLMAGFLTRAAALTSIGLSVVLMLMFGWQGATCIDGIESFCALQMSPTQAAFPPGLVSQLFGPTKQSCAQAIFRAHIHSSKTEVNGCRQLANPHQNPAGPPPPAFSLCKLRPQLSPPPRWRRFFWHTRCR